MRPTRSLAGRKPKYAPGRKTMLVKLPREAFSHVMEEIATHEVTMTDLGAYYLIAGWSQRHDTVPMPAYLTKMWQTVGMSTEPLVLGARWTPDKPIADRNEARLRMPEAMHTAVSIEASAAGESISDLGGAYVILGWNTAHGPKAALTMPEYLQRTLERVEAQPRPQESLMMA